MKLPAQPRASALTRCTAALALAGFSLSAIAQAVPVQPPPSATKGPSSADKARDIAAPSKHQLDEAEDAYLAGARLLEHKDIAGAEKQFSKAVKLNPANNDYALSLDIAHEQHVTGLVQQAGKARLMGQKEKADTLLAEARLLDPHNAIVAEHLDADASGNTFHPEIEPWIRDAPSLAGPITLLPNSDKQTFHLHSDEQEVIAKVLKSYGIRAVFDDSVEHEKLGFDLENTQYQQAVPILMQMAHLMAVPLDSTSVIIAKDTPENRERYERLLQETIYISGMSNEQMDELGNVLKNVFGIKKITVEKTSRNLVLLAPQDVLTPLNLTLADLIDGGSEVMIELRLYSVAKTRQQNIGTQVPTQIGVYSVASEANNIVAQNQDLVNQAIALGLVPAGASNTAIAVALIASGLVQSTLLSNTIGLFGGGITTGGVTVNQHVAFNLALNSSDTRGLDDIQSRVSNRETATFRVGSRYPITTSTYTSGSSAAASSLTGITINGAPAASLLNQISAVTIPEIQYQDLGLTLKATPVVQKSGEITMHLDLKIESLSGNSISNIPILNNEAFVSDVTVPDGQTAVLFGTVSRSQSAAIDGLPGLGELPGFQTFTADKTTERDSSELLMLVTPHIVRRRSDETVGPRIAVNIPVEPD